MTQRSPEDPSGADRTSAINNFSKRSVARGRPAHVVQEKQATRTNLPPSHFHEKGSQARPWIFTCFCHLLWPTRTRISLADLPQPQPQLHSFWRTSRSPSLSSSPFLDRRATAASFALLGTAPKPLSLSHPLSSTRLPAGQFRLGSPGPPFHRLQRPSSRSESSPWPRASASVRAYG